MQYVKKFNSKKCTTFSTLLLLDHDCLIREYDPVFIRAQIWCSSPPTRDNIGKLECVWTNPKWSSSDEKTSVKAKVMRLTPSGCERSYRTSYQCFDKNSSHFAPQSGECFSFGAHLLVLYGRKKVSCFWYSFNYNHLLAAICKAFQIR